MSSTFALTAAAAITRTHNPAAKLLSLVFVFDGGKPDDFTSPGKRVLLGLKKRGFGEGNWNGFGGKKEDGETLRKCAARELEEESGLTVKEENLKRKGILHFTM